MDVINENATFDVDDVFHRVEVAKKAMELIKNHPHDRGACVIDIDAPWGMGKTTLLKMWINELEKEDEQSRNYNVFSNVINQCVYYNAWENDYNNDALTPLIYTICGNIYIKYNKTDKWLTEFKEKMKAMISAGVGIVTSHLCNQSTGNSILASGMGEMAMATTNAVFHLFEGKEPEDIGKSYIEEIEKRTTFHEAVSSLAESCGKLFIFIDELDRCKPTFAVQTMECIKHYFNIPNVVFIFATDMSQLAHTVETYYGHGMDAGGYFLKFFDYIMHLPIPNIQELMHNAYPNIQVNEAFYNFVNEIRKNFNLTPRETPWIIKRSNAIWKTAFSGQRRIDLSSSFAFITLMITIKAKMPNRFSNWLTQKDAMVDVFIADKESFIGQCSLFFQKYLSINTYDLEQEISQSNESHIRKKIDGVQEREIDYQDVFLHTTYAVCASQIAISQTVGEALLASLELS